MIEFRQVPSGWMADRFGGIWVLAVSMIVESVLAMLIPAAAHLHVIAVIVLRALAGVFDGVQYPTGQRKERSSLNTTVTLSWRPASDQSLSEVADRSPVVARCRKLVARGNWSQGGCRCCTSNLNNLSTTDLDTKKSATGRRASAIGCR